MYPGAGATVDALLVKDTGLYVCFVVSPEIRIMSLENNFLSFSVKLPF